MKIVKTPLFFSGEEKSDNFLEIVFNFLGRIKSNERGVFFGLDRFAVDELVIDKNSLDVEVEKIKQKSIEFYKEKEFLIFLGGQRVLTYGTLSGFKEFCEENKKKCCAIVFDAFSNCESEEELVRNETWLRQIVSEGFSGRDILLVGSRNNSESELDFLKKNHIKVISLNQIKENLAESVDVIMEFCSKRELYVSFDICSLDLAFAPGALRGCVGGFSSREILYIFDRIRKIKTFRAFDIVGGGFENDPLFLTARFASVLLAEFIEDED